MLCTRLDTWCTLYGARLCVITDKRRERKTNHMCNATLRLSKDVLNMFYEDALAICPITASKVHTLHAKQVLCCWELRR